MKKLRKPLEQHKTKGLTVRFTENEYQEIKMFALKHQIKKTKLLRKTLFEHLQQNK